MPVMLQMLPAPLQTVNVETRVRYCDGRNQESVPVRAGHDPNDSVQLLICSRLLGGVKVILGIVYAIKVAD